MRNTHPLCITCFTQKCSKARLLSRGGGQVVIVTDLCRVLSVSRAKALGPEVAGWPLAAYGGGQPLPIIPEEEWIS